MSRASYAGRRSRGPRTLFALLSAFVMLISGCGGAQGPETVELQDLPPEVEGELNALYEAARASGQTEVVVYGPDVAGQQDVWEVFNRRYPEITVEPVHLVGGGLTGKVQQEVTSGNVVVDLIVSTSTSHVELYDLGYYQEYVPIGSENVVDLGRGDIEGYYYGPFGTAFSIAYNTNLVSEDEAPRSWEDLLDPRWQGKIVVADPTKLNMTTGTFSGLKEGGVIDDDWLRGFRDQNPVIVGQGPQVNPTLASGEAEVGLTALPYVVPDQERGAPIEFIFPFGGGSRMNAHHVALMAEAPHPDAAKLLYSWMFTAEAQEAFANHGSYPLVRGSQPPEGFPPAEELDNLVIVPDRRGPHISNAMVEQMTTLFRR